MITADELRSIARRVTPLAMDIYDREDMASVLSLVAQIVPNPGKEKTGSLEWITAFPELRLWLDERTVQKAFAGRINWRGERHEITLEYDQNDAQRESALLQAQQLGGRIATAFASGKVVLALKVLRENLLAYDGQNLFDTDHVHPNGKPYTNLLTIGRVDPAAPTIGEARDELKAHMRTLMENRLIRNTVTESSVVADNLIIFCKSAAVWQAYEDLRTEERIGGDINRLRGKFRLFRDFDPLAGTENMVDAIWAEPGGPRPVGFVATREPNGLQFDESKAFSHAKIPFGMDGEYGIVALLPQSAARSKPV